MKVDIGKMEKAKAKDKIATPACRGFAMTDKKRQWGQFFNIDNSPLGRDLIFDIRKMEKEKANSKIAEPVPHMMRDRPAFRRPPRNDSVFYLSSRVPPQAGPQAGRGDLAVVFRQTARLPQASPTQ